MTGSLRRSIVVAALVAAWGAAGSAGAQAVAGASAEWQKVLAGAKREASVTLYGSPPPEAMERIVAGFRKVHPGIEIGYFRGATAQVLPRIESERTGNLDGGDLWITTEIAWLRDRHKEGRLLKPAGPSLQGWPADSLLQGTIVLAGREPFVIPYNTQLVSAPPKGYLDLLKPEFRGKIGTSDLVATTVIAFYDWLEKTQDKDYLAKLKAQNPKLYLGGQPISQSVASGEIVIGAFSQPTATKPLKNKGAPIDYVIPSPGLGVQYAFAALGWSKRPNAALLLADYLMSVEGQTAWHGSGETASPRTGIRGSLAYSGITPWDTEFYTPAVSKEYRERWTRIFK